MMRARSSALLVAASLLLVAAAAARNNRALLQVVDKPVDPLVAEEFSVWLSNMTVAVHMDECNFLGGKGWASPRCSLIANSSAPAYPVPRADGAEGAAWVTYLDFEHANNMTAAIVFDAFNYDITLDAPAAADNAILGVMFATVNASGAITCYGKLFKGEVESCAEFVLSELPLANGEVKVDPAAPANASVVKGGSEVLGLTGNITASTAGESVVFLSEEGVKEAAPHKEFDFVFLVIANGGFTINSVGFAEPGLHPSTAPATTIEPVTPGGESPAPPVIAAPANV